MLAGDPAGPLERLDGDHDVAPIVKIVRASVVIGRESALTGLFSRPKTEFGDEQGGTAIGVELTGH